MKRNWLAGWLAEWTVRFHSVNVWRIDLCLWIPSHSRVISARTSSLGTRTPFSDIFHVTSFHVHPFRRASIYPYNIVSFESISSSFQRIIRGVLFIYLRKRFEDATGQKNGKGEKERRSDGQLNLSRIQWYDCFFFFFSFERTRCKAFRYLKKSADEECRSRCARRSRRWRHSVVRSKFDSA